MILKLRKVDGKSGIRIRHPGSRFGYFLLSNMKTLLGFVLFATLGATAQIQYEQVSREVIEQRLDTAEKANKDREEKLFQLFAEVGCEPSRARVGGSKLQNVVCILPGETPDQIVVGAHFDHVSSGMGVVDNWTGASMLPSLYQSLKGKPRKHTIVFVGFADEEKGLVGARYWTEKLTKAQREQIQAMVNIDSLGLTPTKVWISHAAPMLVNWAAAVSKSSGFRLNGSNVDGVGNGDSDAFYRKRIPTIDFHSLTAQTFPVLHTDRDTKKAVDMEAYYESYRFVALYLAYIDTQLDARVREDFAKKGK
jgi:Zn-dependent M28 family amino/carboxypeptidase